MYLYHGTDMESAKNIAKYGVDMKKSHKGYFGIGFYTATNENLAKSNYADFADDEGEPGTVLKFKLNSNAKILDLDKPKDFEEYKNAKWKGVPITDLRHLDNFNEIMVDLGFDGLRDEGSFGGIVIYNPKSIKLVEELKFASKSIALQYLADFTGQRVKIAENSKYPKAGSIVDGLKVRSEIPNTGSISATFTDYSELSGIREVPMSEFDGPKSVFYAANDFERSRNLAKKIKESGEINPLIIAVDKDGPYILEGVHRYVALYYLEKKSFPALVVIDEDENNSITASDKTSKYHGNIDILKKEAEKYNNGEELLKDGGFSIEALDRTAFGFANEDIKELDPEDLNIQWNGDYENVLLEVKDSGLSDEEWSKKVSLSTPIEVVYKDGKFYIDDGHHRYFAAKTLGKKLKVNLRIEEKPIPKIVGTKNYNYDEFHRSFFALVKNADIRDVTSLKRYLKNKPFHIYDHAHEFDSYSNKHQIMEKANVEESSWNKAMEESDWDELEDLSDKLSKAMSEKDQEDFIYHLHQQDSAEAPSWAHMDLESFVLPGNTWLVHFSDDADSIKQEGFTYGVDQMDKLGLTTYFGKSAKEHGGYNFAFLADSRDASSAANGGKYGSDAVLFRATGLKVYHHGDQETQIIFYGKDVNPNDIVLLSKDGGDWQVVGGERGFVFESENFSDIVNWVEKNYSQYAKVLRKASKTISIFEAVDEETLNDPREQIYHLIDLEEERNFVYDVKSMNADKAKSTLKTMNEDSTVFQAYKDFATDDQKELVSHKKRLFDRDRIIVTSRNKVVDGNHHVIAAIELGKPILYIDLQDPIEKKTASSVMEVYRGEFSGNKGGKYWSTDKEWAAQFTQTGRIEEVQTRRIREQDIFSSDPLPYAGDPEEIEEAIKEAKKKGFKYVRLDEGRNEPDSIYIF